MDNSTISKIFTWLYRTFCYFVPAGVSLYTFLIDNLIDDAKSTRAKLSGVGIFVLVIIVVIAIFFYKKHLTKGITDSTNAILECTDEQKKLELIDKKKKFESAKELFSNVCFLAPFVILWAVCSAIEKQMFSLRGVLLVIVLSMASGFGFNVVAQKFKNKKD